MRTLIQRPSTLFFATFTCALAAACGGAQAPSDAACADWLAAESLEAGVDAEVADAEEQSVAVPEVGSDEVILDGTPEIPDEMRQRLNNYLNVRSASLSSLSDDGTSMLLRTRFGETYQLHQLTQPMGAREQLTFFEEPISSSAYRPGADHQLIYLTDVGGTEEYQLFMMDRDAGETTTLTEGGRAGGALFSPDGATIVYSYNDLVAPDTHIWMMSPDAPAGASVVLPMEGYWYPLDFSDDGGQLLVGRYISSTESEVWLLDLSALPTDMDSDNRTPDELPITRITPEEPAAYPFAVFAGDDVLLATDQGAEFVNLYRWPLDGGEPEMLNDGIEWNVEDVAVSADGETLAFATNEGGFSRLYTVDLDSGDRTPVASLPDGILYGLQFAREADVLAFTFNSATSPGDIYSYDIEDDAMVRWTQSEIGGLDPDGFRDPSLVSFTSFDGLEIPAFLYEPDGEGPHPVVISIHGGPESQSRPYFSSTVQYLVNELDVAVLVPNVRGSDGYGRTYLTLDNGMLREDSVRDIGAGLDWIAENPTLDEDRVGVLGGSYGGYMVLASLMHYSDRIAAGVDVVGISNFVTFLENTGDYRRDLRRVEYGDERDEEMRAHLLSISPTENVDRIQSALFVAQGANDPRVPATEAQQIVDAVRGAGRDVWYMLAMNEGHGFSKKENRDTYTLLMLMFFMEHLGLE